MCHVFSMRRKNAWFLVNMENARGTIGHVVIWEDHLDTIGIDPNSKCEAVILKVVAYVECDPPIYV